ncbi:hypothetical protein KF728_21345 [Candidatus Obscuribacterales bacterium]|nr:hypothetical protein [Candidatus Obscuribacterales bacterium]MBX3152717.1 hypothetical protein [Candidatus Obscuribacterales bacterium]
MRRNNRFAAVCAISSIISSFPLSASAETLKLEEGTAVRLKLLDSISSGSNHQGDSVSFRVVDDVLGADEKTILIKAGTPAWGSISNLEERGHMGEKGQLSLSIEGTKSVDGKKIPLRAAVNRDGKAKLGTVIALSFIVTPLFLFMRGKDATIAAGTQVNTYVDRDMHVDVTAVTSKSVAQSEPAALNVTAAVVSPAVAAPEASSSPNVSADSAETSTTTEPSPQAKATETVQDETAALDKLYQSGLLTKKEYATKLKALTKKRIAALDASR